jgi:hypothetical protein
MKFNIGYGTPGDPLYPSLVGVMLTTGQGSAGLVPLPKDISRYDLPKVASIRSSADLQ